nr:cytochrome C oxidase subunit IV family protein [Rhodoplanes elegans]
MIGLAVASLAVTMVLPYGAAASALVLAAAVLKGRVVVLDFLGLRDAPAVWRGLIVGWVVLIGTIAWLAATASLLR